MFFQIMFLFPGRIWPTLTDNNKEHTELLEKHLLNKSSEAHWIDSDIVYICKDLKHLVVRK